MKAYQSFILILVIAIILADIILLFTGQKDPAVFFIVDVLIYLTVVLAHTKLNTRLQNSLNRIGTALFGGFLVVLIIQLIQII